MESKKSLSIFGISIWRIFAYFIIYAILGYLIESLFAFLSEGVIESRQSFLYGPFCAIYGLGAVVMIVGLQKFKNRKSTLIIGGIILGAVTEYLVSWIGEIFFGVKWWDYSDMAFNINGRICATYSIAWGALGLILVKYINPKIDNYIDRIPQSTLKYVTSILMIFLLFDWLVSSIALEMFYVRMEDTKNIELRYEEDENHKLSRTIYNIPFLKTCIDWIWSDKIMIKTFPNLRTTTKTGAVIYVRDLYKEIQPYYFRVFEPLPSTKQ